MLGSRRHLAHGWDQSVFVLLSVLALLAFALFPVAASADSAGAEYQNAVPTPYGGSHKAPTVVGGGEDDDAHASKKGGGTGGTGAGSDGGSSESGNAGTPATQGSGDGEDGNGSTTSQHPNGGKDAGKTKVANFEEVPSPGAESDDGGSSPLVPILIVIALLAAISVGVVVWQRRRGDTPITPKAG
jgi:cobalamin biosynthesis Mg chelatase CobN